MTPGSVIAADVIQSTAAGTYLFIELAEVLTNRERVSNKFFRMVFGIALLSFMLGDSLLNHMEDIDDTAKVSAIFKAIFVSCALVLCVLPLISKWISEAITGTESCGPENDDSRNLL